MHTPEKGVAMRLTISEVKKCHDSSFLLGVPNNYLKVIIVQQENYVYRES